MDTSTPILLIDGETRRRAAISHTLSGGGVHVEPFETVEELGGHWPRRGLVLAHDEGQALGDLLVRMSRHGNWLPVVAFAEAPSPRRIVDAVLEGAIDYVSWPFDEGELDEALTSATQRAEAMGSAKLREAMARSRIEKLTRREREVLAGVADGLSNRKIGEKLSISPRTVEIHRANMLNKMGANHTSEAIRIAIEAALVE
jgi:two-component system, LuxR family, response regulator FixJ